MSQLKAYIVKEPDEGACEIVFATSGIAARRIGANEHGIEFNEVESCLRAPWADPYAGAKFIPPQAWLDAGYLLQCSACTDHVSLGDPATIEEQEIYCGNCREVEE